MVKHEAAWLPKPHGRLEVREGPDAQVGENDVLIENKAVAINPGNVTHPKLTLDVESDSGTVDWKIQDYNVIVKEYPVVRMIATLSTAGSSLNFCLDPG